MPVPAKILIIEDDRKLSSALASGIEAAGYEAHTASSGEEGFFLVHRLQPDLLLLDLTLPQRNGLEVLQQIREEGLDVRVLILTSHSHVEDRVIGLKSGADDYLGKPFSFPELLARIEALLRRVVSNAGSRELRLGDLIIDTTARTAIRGSHQLSLSQREFSLLVYFAENRGRPVSREMLARDIWQETSRYTPIDNVIDVQMARLRKKLDDPFPTKLLHTVRGIGFILKAP